MFLRTKKVVFSKAMINKYLCRALKLLILPSCIIFVWPEICYDLIFEELDLILYKYRANRTGYVCVKRKGDLGNLLFQYAFAYVMTRRWNMTLVCSQEQMHELESLFTLPDCSNNHLGLRVCQSRYRTTLSKSCGYDKGVDNLTFNKDLYLDGYFQSWKYWHEHEATFREYFSIKQDVQNDAKKLLESKLSRLGYTSTVNISLVGVHIRRGDMIEEADFNFGYNVVDTEYVLKAKRYISDRVKGPIVYVFASNDMEWTKYHLPETSAIHLEGNSKFLDFAILSMCDHLITSVGTFGWWSGWHVKGIVTYYTKPFRPNTQLAGLFADDYLESFFKPNWVGLN